MKWKPTMPTRGCMVRCEISGIYHYGIFVSDGEVIQFGLPPASIPAQNSEDIKVLSTDIDTFLCGRFLEVGIPVFSERLAARSPDEVVAYARSRLGTGGYQLLYNNCEHFANECVFGKKKCEQVEEVRRVWQNIAVMEIYLCRSESADDLLRLALFALKHSFGKTVKEADLMFNRNDFIFDEIRVSSDTSGNILAVAVSKQPVHLEISDKTPESVADGIQLRSFSAEPFLPCTVSVTAPKIEYMNVFYVKNPDTPHAERITLPSHKGADNAKNGLN